MLVPGPGAYQDTNLDKFKNYENRGVKFGNSGRSDLGDKLDVPGPGSFNIGSKFKGGYSFGSSKRNGIAELKDTPGPGEYTLGSFKVKFTN